MEPRIDDVPPHLSHEEYLALRTKSVLKNSKRLFDRIVHRIKPGAEPTELQWYILEDYMYIRLLYRDYALLMRKGNYVLVMAILRMVTDRVIEMCWVADDPKERLPRVNLKVNQELLRTLSGALKHGSENLSDHDQLKAWNAAVEQLIEQIKWKHGAALKVAPKPGEMAQHADCDEESLSWLYYKSFRYFSGAIHFNPFSAMQPFNIVYDPVLGQYRIVSALVNENAQRYMMAACLYLYCCGASGALGGLLKEDLSGLRSQLESLQRSLFPRVERFDAEL